MPQPSEEIERIATLLGADYLRSLNLSEANVAIHYKDQSNSIIIFDGVPDIATVFEGAEGIDTYTTTIYFLTRKTKTTEDAIDIDPQIEAMKELANKFYFALELPRPVLTYTLEYAEITNDFLIGYLMTIELPFNGNIC